MAGTKRADQAFDNAPDTPVPLRDAQPRAGKPAARLFVAHPWIQVEPDPPMPDTWLASVLDAGEAATIALALRENPRFVLIDERKGRRIADHIYRLPLIGTAGIL